MLYRLYIYIYIYIYTIKKNRSWNFIHTTDKNILLSWLPFTALQIFNSLKARLFPPFKFSPFQLNSMSIICYTKTMEKFAN